jgi:hypothetical protein
MQTRNAREYSVARPALADALVDRLREAKALVLS